jgi:hypothetical protein
MLLLLRRQLSNAEVLRIPEDSGSNHSRVEAPATKIGLLEEGARITMN